MQHDQVVVDHWPDLYGPFLRFQFALLEQNTCVGIGNAVPLRWTGPFEELPGEGIDWAMETAAKNHSSGQEPNLLVGIQIMINPLYAGRGLSYEMLKIMKGLASSNGIQSLALPVRPTLKSQHPEIPIQEYITWENENGLPYDPWIRVHVKAGAKIAGLCPRSMLISGSLEEWESWTGQKFPQSGKVLVDGALSPIVIDPSGKGALYTEPNVWLIHPSH